MDEQSPPYPSVPAELPGPRDRAFQVEPCRPRQRGPALRLHVFDDGRDSAEIVRIRKSPFVIGRCVGDIRIPHDARISDPHVEIVWRERTWRLRDLQSQTGTFVRVRKARIRDGQVIQVGARRYRFDQGTAVVELTPDGEGPRHRWQGTEVWIGRDPALCAVVLSDDPMVNPRHVRLWEESDQTWFLADAKSLNGTWLRLNEVPLECTVEFLLGEQRFRIVKP